MKGLIGRLKETTAAVAVAGLVAAPVSATDDCFADAMIVFDGSGSMGEITLETGAYTRIVEVREAVARVMPDLSRARELGLVTYGATEFGGGCESVRVRFPPEPFAGPRIVDTLDRLLPGGLTPLTDAVAEAARVLNYRSDPATVVLVTDGNETCGGRPCATGEAMEAVGYDLTIHVIGFRVVVDFFEWDSPEQKAYVENTSVAKCLADHTGGKFVTADTVEELVAALDDTLGCPVIGRL